MTTDIDPQAANGSAFRHASRQIRLLLRRNWRPFYIFLTIGVDAGSICLAGIVVYAIRIKLGIAPAMQPGTATVIILGCCCANMLAGLLNGLYRSVSRIPFRDQIRQAAKAYVYSAFMIVFGMYLMMGSGFPPRFTGVILILIPISLVAGRWAVTSVNRFLQTRGYGLYNSMIVNWDGAGASYPSRYVMFQELGYKVQAFACMSGRREGCAVTECPLQVHFSEANQSEGKPSFRPLRCYGPDELAKAIATEDIERIFVPLVLPVVSGFSDIIRACMRHRVKLKVISRESEELLRFSRIRDIAGISLYSPLKEKTTHIKAYLKRAFDIVGCLFLILLFSPVFVVVTFAILLEDGRPVLFRQRRAPAMGGKTFDLLKFRSMVKDAEARQSELGQWNETEGGLFRMQNDPRVTRVGRWTRMTSMDELPQLFNVLKGEMSLVGPRPLTLSDLTKVSPDNDYAGYYYLRNNTPPGITGLWQICGRRDVQFRDMVLLDLYYIENQSVMFDLEILFATIPVVLFGRGAY